MCKPGRLCLDSVGLVLSQYTVTWSMSVVYAPRVVTFDCSPVPASYRLMSPAYQKFKRDDPGRL